MREIYVLSLVVCLLSASGCNTNPSVKEKIKSRQDIFLDNIKGNDRNTGTRSKPLKSINELNRRLEETSYNVYLQSGQVFSGTLILKGIRGSESDPVKIYSSGDEKAVINGGNGEAAIIQNCSFIKLGNLNLTGNGRKDGNKTNGLALINSSYCRVEDVTSKGFQKSGIDLYNCSNSVVRRALVSENGFSGLNIMGSARNMSHNITIKDCKAENNPGDPTNFENHSGNGILVGVSDSVTVDHCTATNNGWDMPRQGNGPVGIWTWESVHVLIQFCISYRNKTSENAKDGGGFDLDGGVRNSLIQYCLSYENQGAGYGLFQYSGASDWSANTVRYCISFNDAQKTEGSGGVFIWNGSGVPDQLKDCRIYNNLIYSTAAPAISYENASKHQSFLFMNNIFIYSGKPISGILAGSSFIGNDWWNMKGERRFMEFPDLESWAMKNHQEILKGKFIGMQADPKFIGPLGTDITDPYQLDKLTGFMIDGNSPLRNHGFDPRTFFGGDIPVKDFYGKMVPSGPGYEPGINEIN
jgi:hypothetical protein